VGMTITLDIRSDDVQHSWWIPELGGKMDALPGYTNKTWFQVKEEGTYQGQCAELCGRNHANMLAEVIALPFDEWQAWYDREAQEIKDAEEYAADEREQVQQSEGDEATQGTSGASNVESESEESE
jgi:cytochrome c oxidase subunit 2